MPTYEYQCTACGHRFEEFQSIKADPIEVCPSCKKKKAKRLISGGAGFIFKGSGFYITDYRSESYKSAAKSDTAPSAPAATPASSGSTTSSSSSSASTGSSAPASGASSSSSTSKSS